MNFKEFRESYFYKVGRSRFDYKNQKYIPWFFPMYDTMPIPQLSSTTTLYEEYIPPPHGNVTVMPLLRALELQPVSIDEPPFIPKDFKEDIIRQWREVTDINQKITKEHNEAHPDRPIRLTHSMLLITEPGQPVYKHTHQCKQTLTMAYRYNDDNLPEAEPSYFALGDDLSKKAYFPDSDRFIFTMVNDPPHENRSREWIFFWFNDYDDYFEMPTDLPFTYMENKYLDGNNLK